MPSGGFFDRDGRLQFLEKKVPLFEQYQNLGRVEEVWPLIITPYLEKYPDDDVPEVPYERTRTKTGKISLKRPPGIPMDIHTVSYHLCRVRLDYKTLCNSVFATGSTMPRSGRVTAAMASLLHLRTRAQ